MEEKREGTEKGTETGQRLGTGKREAGGREREGEVGKTHFVKGKTVNVHGSVLSGCS